MKKTACAYDDYANLEIAGSKALTSINIDQAHAEALEMNSFCDKFDEAHKDDDIAKDWDCASLLNTQINLWTDEAKSIIHN